MDECAFAGSLAASTLDRRVRRVRARSRGGYGLARTVANAIEFERYSYDLIPVGRGADEIVAERATEGAGTPSRTPDHGYDDAAQPAHTSTR